MVIEIKREEEKKRDEIGMLYELKIWQGFDSQSITQKSEQILYLSFQIKVMMGRMTNRNEDLEEPK